MAPRRTASRNGSSKPVVALVVKRSAWQHWLEEKNDGRMRDLIDRGDATVSRMRAAHEAHTQSAEAVDNALQRLGARVVTTLGARKPFDSTGYDLVVTVGGDGTLLRASHQVVDVPVLGINSAPAHLVGFFCGARAGEVDDALRDALAGKMKAAVLTRMQVRVNGEIVAARVLNDALYCHASPAATSRYLVELGNLSEEHKSSGFWIGPAAGSTAAQRSAGGSVLPLSSKRIQLVVREPYTPHGETYRLAHAFLRPGNTLVVRTKMREARIFLDGPDEVRKCRFGDVIEFTHSDQSLILLGISSRRRWEPVLKRQPITPPVHHAPRASLEPPRSKRPPKSRRST